MTKKINSSIDYRRIQYDSIEDFLKAMKRPVTFREIVDAFKNRKNYMSLNSELKTGIKWGEVVKIRIPFGNDRNFVAYGTPDLFVSESIVDKKIKDKEID